MHPDVVDDRPGKCPICRMKLEPVRLDTVWSCPVHEVITAPGPGRCRICGRELVHVTAAVSWTCGAAERLEPGTCPDGSAAKAKYIRRPHGNHNPQHGGEFFMAPDAWHHFEGVYAVNGVFRLYVYDDYSRPLSAIQLQRISGVVTSGRETTLTAARGGEFLEARLGPAATLPAAITAKVTFTPGGPAHQFDFTFSEYSREDVRPKADATNQNRPPNVASDVSRTSQPLPELRSRASELKAIIDRGAFGEIYVPACAAKDLALATAAGAAGESAERRAAIEAATSRVVRAAWKLDEAGDLGNRDQIMDAYAQFSTALSELETTLTGARR